MSDPQQPLKEFKPQHEFFVGIDSDGCAFDTMEVKQLTLTGAPSTRWRSSTRRVSIR